MYLFYFLNFMYTFAKVRILFINKAQKDLYVPFLI